MLKNSTVAAFRRSAVFACLGLSLASVPALARPADDADTSVRVTVAPPMTPMQRDTLRNRIADAAEAACGSDSRSVPDFRYSVRNSACFRDSYASAVAQLRDRWGSAAAGMM